MNDKNSVLSNRYEIIERVGIGGMSYVYKAYDLIANAKDKEEVLLYLIKFLLKFMNTLGWGLDLKNCSVCQNKLNEQDNKSTLFSFELGGFLCENCIANSNGATVRIHDKIKAFLLEVSKVSTLDEKTIYDDKTNLVVLEKCFLFLKKYIDNLTNKRTHVFEVLDKVSI